MYIVVHCKQAPRARRFLAKHPPPLFGFSTATKNCLVLRFGMAASAPAEAPPLTQAALFRAVEGNEVDTVKKMLDPEKDKEHKDFCSVKNGIFAPTLTTAPARTSQLSAPPWTTPTGRELSPPFPGFPP